MAADDRLPLPRFALFISNPTRSVAVFRQRASASVELPVLWDYHVVLVAGRPRDAVVFDLDTRLPFPSELACYLDASFPSPKRLPLAFRPRFRLVEAPVFRESFASDRSHMITSRGLRAPLPPWPQIRGKSETMNLFRFIDVEAPFLGELLDLEGLRARFQV